MALDFQNVPVDFSKGLDTKSDPKQVIPGKMLSLKNASFDSPKEIKKRDGNESLPTSINGGSSIAKGVGVSNFKDELVTLDGSNLYALSENLDQQFNRGVMKPIDLSVSPVIRNINTQTNPDSAYDSVTGLKCFAWTDSGSGGINYSIVDSVTGTFIVNNSIVSSTGRVPRVILVGTYFVISFYDSSGTKYAYRAISTATPTTLGSETTIASGVSLVDPPIDACLINGSCYFAYGMSSTQIGVRSLSSSLVLSSQYTQAVTGVPIDINVVGDASNNVWVFFSISGSTKAFIVNSALSLQLLANTVIEAITSLNITAVISGTTASVYYETLAAGASGSANDTSHMIKFNTLTFAGTAGTASIKMRGVGIASKLFQYQSETYFLVVYAGEYLPSPTSISQLTTQEPTYFLINSSAQVLLKLAPMNGGYYYSSLAIPQVNQISSGVLSVPYLLQENVTSVNGTIVSTTGVQNAILDFNTDAPSKLNIANNLLLSGGQLWSYDGESVVEQGFHLYPENLSYTQAVAGGIGSSLNTGSTINQVQYVATYEWIDNQGQLNRSAPSPVLTVQLPAAASLTAVTFTGTTTANSNVITSVSSTTNLYVGQIITDTTHSSTLPANTYITRIDSLPGMVYVSNNATAANAGDTFSTKDVCTLSVKVPTLRQTLKQNVSIALYRTQNNQTIFYRVTNPSQPTYNNTAVDYVTIVDTSPDSIIVGNEQLYTTGGEVDNIAAPAVFALTAFKNRAIYLAAENPFQWGYSKQAIPGTPVEFNSLEFVQNVDQRIGSLSAIGTLDDKIILFGPNSKFFVVGDGPTPAGTNNDFTEATRIAGTTGCSNQASILELPVGLVYQDPLKGIYLLDRSLQEQFIGAEVSQYNSLKVTSAQKFEDNNRAIFTLEDGTNLVYDYYVGQWETDIYASAAIDSTIYDKKLVYIQVDGQSFKQTPNAFTDNGSFIPLSFKTGWLSFASIEGFQRVIELQILGTWKSAHSITVNIYYDFLDVAAQSVVIDASTNPGLYQYRVHLKNQKCESIQVEIIESQSSPYGEGLSLSALEFRVGVKRGLNKLPAGKSF